MRKELVQVLFDTAKGRVSAASWILAEVTETGNGRVMPEVFGTAKDSFIEVLVEAQTLAEGISNALPFFWKTMGALTNDN